MIVVPNRDTASVYRYAKRDKLLDKVKAIYKESLIELKMIDVRIFVICGGELVVPVVDKSGCHLCFSDGTVHQLDPDVHPPKVPLGALRPAKI